MARQLSMKPEAVAARKRRAKKAQKNGTTATAQASTAAQAPDIDTTQAAGIQIGVEDAPESTFEEEKKPGILESVLTKLGIKEDPKSPAVKAPTSAKLNDTQKQFCDMATPIANSLLIISLAWAWGQLDEDYRALAPSEQAAESIVAPLIRIYARSNKALIRSASPNTVDALMCLNGCIMYLHASLTLLHQINAMKREEADESNRPRDIRSTRASEAGPHSSGDRRNGIQRSNYGSAQGVVASANTLDTSNLSERERQNFISLSALRERDIAARARRSGRLG